MRLLAPFLIFAATLFGQGGGSVQFRDWNPRPPAAKPVTSCGQLLGLTDFELSVISATLVPSGSAPEHCHVFLMAQPEITSPIVGPRDRKQLLANLSAVDIELDADTMAAIDTVVPPGGAVLRL